MSNEKNTDISDKLVSAIPGVCGGHAIIKGHRIEVSNLVSDLYYSFPTVEGWIAAFKANDWIIPAEINEVLSYCKNKTCKTEGITCCHCTLNPKEQDKPDNNSFNGWELAEKIIKRLEKRKKR